MTDHLQNVNYNYIFVQRTVAKRLGICDPGSQACQRLSCGVEHRCLESRQYE